MHFNVPDIWIYKTILIFIIINSYSSVTAQNNQSISLSKINFKLGITYETVKFNNRESYEKMGLYGVNFDFIFKQPFIPNLYFILGPGGYGSVTGERGGFFVGGYGFGMAIFFSDYFKIESGVFAGGGGGGSAPQGSGLMIREYISAGFNLHHAWINVGVSRIDFPDGKIKGAQVFGGISYPFSIWQGDTVNIISPEAAVPLNIFKIYPRLFYQFSRPDNNNIKIDDTEIQEIHSAGFRLDNFFSSHTLFTFSLSGSFHGKVDGYAEMFFGLGWSQRLFKDFYVNAVGNIGTGGGGRVNTGGGLLFKPAIELGMNSLLLSAGKIFSINKNYNMYFIETALGSGIELVSFSDESDGLSVPDNVSFSQFIVQALNKTYLPSGSLRNKSGEPLENFVNLVGFNLKMPFKKLFYISGEGYGAYTGKIGGYAEGEIGLGICLPILGKLFFDMKFLAGAAGGGGVNVGEGFIYEADAGLVYKLNKLYFMNLTIGKSHSKSGTFDPIIIEAGVGYCLNLAVKSL